MVEQTEEDYMTKHTCEEEGDNTDCECIPCGIRDCPHKEPLHYHHDGCPACYKDSFVISNFSKEELLEIEKVFDTAAALHTKAYAEIIALLSRHPASKDYADKISSEAVHAYDSYRTISARAHALMLEK